MSSDNHHPAETVSRREALKAAAALGAAVAASSLVPSRWSKPKVGLGALPVHAQGSVPPPPPPNLELTCRDNAYVGVNIDPNAPITSESKVALQVAIDPPAAGVVLRVYIGIFNDLNNLISDTSQTATTDANGEAHVDYVIRNVTGSGFTLKTQWRLEGEQDTLCQNSNTIEFVED